MDEASEVLGYGFVFGYVDTNGEEIGLGSGPKTIIHGAPADYVVWGNMTAEDTGCFGSGTKGFTATAIMKLVEAGKVDLDTPAYVYIDVSL